MKASIATVLLAALALACVSCGGDTTCQGASCGPPGSCSIVGTFTNTLSTGGQATLTASGTSASGTFTLAVALSTGGSISIGGNYSVSGAQLTITNTSSAPATVQGCIGQAAVYSLAWSADCSAVTLTKVSDQCAGRIADANGSTLTRNGSSPDAGNPDAGNPDAGNPDAGNPDAGNPDAGNPDAGNPDAGNPDAGNPDAGNPDAGNPDAGNPDAGSPVGLLGSFSSAGITSLTAIGANLYWVDGYGTPGAAIKTVPTAGGTVATVLAEPLLERDLATDGTHLYFLWSSASSSAPYPSEVDSVALDGSGRKNLTAGFSMAAGGHSNPASELFLSGGLLYFRAAGTTGIFAGYPGILSVPVAGGQVSTVVAPVPGKQVLDLAWVDAGGLYYAFEDPQEYSIVWQAIGGNTGVKVYGTGTLLTDGSWTRSLTVVNGTAWFFASGLRTWTPPSGSATLVAPWPNVSAAGLIADAQEMFMFAQGGSPGLFTVYPPTGAQFGVDSGNGNLNLRMTALDANNIYYGSGSASNHNLALYARQRPTPPPPTAATPVFTPPGGFYQPGGSYHPIQDVVIASNTGATIHYTTDGSTPTSSSPVYSAPIHITATETLTAFAATAGDADSPVVKATYYLPTTAAAAPTFNPPGGTYATGQSVQLTTTTGFPTLYYTTDGSTPTTASTIYSAGSFIQVTQTQTLKAIAISLTTLASPVAAATYAITASAAPADAPQFNPPAGAYATSQSVILTSTTGGASIHYTTDGSAPTAASTLYVSPLLVTASETIKAIATASGYTASSESDAAYTIDPNVTPAATPSFTPAAGTYSSAQSVTISSSTAGASIHYTTDGTTPTTASTLYTAPVQVAANATVKAIATASGHSTSAVASAAYVILTPAGAPIFTPGAGTYASAQAITLSSATAGAAIYFTTDGSTPTTGSTPYSGPVQVSASETLKAIATASGYLASPISTAAYVINAGGATDFPTVCAQVVTRLEQLSETCLKMNPALFSAPGPYGNDNCSVVAGEIAAGRATYSSSQGAACTSALAGLTCAAITSSLPASCQAFTTGTVAQGGTCYVFADCASGGCTATSSTCPGTCQPLGTVGQACGAVGCASGLACDYGASPPACATPSAAAGGPCPCADGFWCDRSGASPACQPQVAGGQSCPAPGSQACALGYVCWGSGTFTCQPLIGQGGSCADGSPLCGEGYTCVSGSCASLPGVGQPCSVSQQNCIGGYCNLQAASPVCVAYVADGGTCDPSLFGQDCASSYCNGASKCGPAECKP